jgi:hypothetical protein
MNTYETTGTVEDHGQLHVAGVPFAPGTQVEVTISPKIPSAQASAHPANGGTGLGWEGNVLVHQGVGADATARELREERLRHLGEGRAG